MAKEFIVRVSAPSPTGKSPLKSRESNESYFYPVTRAVSFWPVVNGNGAFFEEDKLAPLVNSTDEEDGFIGKLVNLWHKKGVDTGNQIIGAIKDQAVVPGSGIDLLARIDRKAADTYGITPEDFAPDGEYSSSSIEIWCDFDKSIFVALTNTSSNKLDDQTIFTADEAEKIGMDRTAKTGYRYQDKYEVVEGMWPLRCRGLAFMDDPADSTANVFELAASMQRGKRMTLDELLASKEALTPGKYHADPGFLEDKKERYQLDTPDNVRSAESLFGMNKDKYTDEQQRHIESEMSEARTRLGMKQADQENSSMTDDSGFVDAPFSISDFNSPTHSYDEVKCSDMSDEECNKLPDEAFAASYTTADGHSRVRKLPLYRTKADYASGKPEPGLVKAAIMSLGKSTYEGGVDLHPNLHAEARNKVRTAHKQLYPQGANQVDPKEKEAIEQAAFEKGVQSKADEIANLNAQVATLTSERDSAKAESADFKTKHDEIATKLATIEEEKASLTKTIEDKKAEELANTRLSELSKIEGFSAGKTDEEKASLLDTLKAESETDYKFRHNAETIASLQRKVAAGPVKAAQEDASKQGEEAAALRARSMSLDGMPVFGAKNEDGTEADATFALM